MALGPPNSNQLFIQTKARWVILDVYAALAPKVLAVQVPKTAPEIMARHTIRNHLVIANKHNELIQLEESLAALSLGRVEGAIVSVPSWHGHRPKRRQHHQMQ